MSRMKILSLDDLYNYYSSTSKRSRHFSAKDENTNIVVQVPGNILFEKENDSQEGLTPVILQSCHIDINANKSKIEKDVMEKALPSFSNRPILGYIHEVDGEWQFYDHRMHVEDEDVVYDERPIGIVPESCNAHLEYDEEKDKTYAVVSGYLFDEYSHAVDILQRDQECACSVELSIRELSYDAKEKVLVIEDFYFSGVTALGKTPEGDPVMPGMSGANIKLADFTHVSNFKQNDVIAMLNEINNKIDQLSIKNLGKEENQMEFEENVEVTETSEEETVVLETAETEETVEETTTEDSTEETVDVTEAKTEEADDTAPSEDKYEVNYTVTYGDQKKEFQLSLQDKISALYQLVNDMYSEQDGCWYDVTVFEDPKYVIMSDWWTGKGYKQNYKVSKDIYSLVGDRTSVKQIWVTEDEEKQLDQMKSNYAAISEKLAKYESEPEKMEILNSAEYSSISDSDEFVAFKEQNAHFDMSVDDVRAKADEMLLSAAKNGKLDFAKSEDTKPQVEMKILQFAKPSSRGRYGGLGKKKDE